jgi:hypothetical protein
VVIWSQSASHQGVSLFTRSRRPRRWLRTGALLTVLALLRAARAGRARWRLLLVAAVLTVVDVAVLHGGLSGLILLLLASAAFLPSRPRAERVRHSEQERELGAFCHPAQRRVVIQALNLQDHQFPVNGRH